MSSPLSRLAEAAAEVAARALVAAWVLALADEAIVGYLRRRSLRTRAEAAKSAFGDDHTLRSA